MWQEILVLCPVQNLAKSNENKIISFCEQKQSNWNSVRFNGISVGKFCKEIVKLICEKSVPLKSLMVWNIFGFFGGGFYRKKSVFFFFLYQPIVFTQKLESHMTISQPYKARGQYHGLSLYNNYDDVWDMSLSHFQGQLCKITDMQGLIFLGWYTPILLYFVENKTRIWKPSQVTGLKWFIKILFVVLAVEYLPPYYHCPSPMLKSLWLFRLE